MNLKAKNVENKEAKYIDKVEIKGMFGRYDVDWQLNPDVNILVGENGTGKSTILDAIDMTLEMEKDKGRKNFYYTMASHLKEKKPDEFYRKVKEDFNGFNTCNIKAENDIEFKGKVVLQDNNDKIYVTTHTEKTFIVPLIKIKTFDNQLSKSDESNKPYINSPLDIELDKQILNYMFYENKKIKNDSNRSKPLYEVLSNSYLFLSMVNKLFKTTDKKLILSDNNDGTTDSIFKLKFENNELISCFDLSSGEKQLLIILLTVLCQDEKPSILLMDEPEISLDVSWQFELISIIRELNPNCQLIIVTHSPAIYGKGWRDKVFFMDDLIPQFKKATV